MDDIDTAIGYMLELACAQAQLPGVFQKGDYLATPTLYRSADPRWLPPFHEFGSLGAPADIKGTVPHRFKLGPIIDLWAKPIADSHGITSWVSMAAISSQVEE